MNQFQTIVAVALVTVGIVGAGTAPFAVRILRPYQRGVVFRLGRLRARGRGPGLTLIVPGLDRLTRVDLTVTTVHAAARDVITRDRVPVGVDAVICFRVVDPVKAVLNVGDHRHTVAEVAAALLCAAVSRAGLDDLLSGRDRVGADLLDAINAVAEGPWGVHAERVDLKEIVLPEYVKRAMAWRTSRERQPLVVGADRPHEQDTTTADASTGRMRRHLAADGSRPNRREPRQPNVRSRWDC